MGQGVWNMPEMMTAIYRGESICVFELVDERGQYIENIRSEYRRAINKIFCHFLSIYSI